MDRLLDFSSDFVISCGSVPMDLSKGLVLLLYYRPKGEYMLSKGRKNAGESLEAAAIRETFEESGFRCHLFKHQLHTNAQLSDTYHTEAIAVQQRMTQGVRKLIFWFISEVDSSIEQKSDTQEEGEEFDVEWVRMEDAPSKCSFVDDRKIVEKALEAVPRPLLPVPVHQLGEAYLDPSIDRQALGFLSISLGGSIVKQHTGVIRSEVDNNIDWDGFGILETKDSIVKLITDFRAELCCMLRIEKEECASMKIPDDPSLQNKWEVLRFSGWTTEGSKRTIKICSKEYLEKAASTCALSYLGLLSHKVRRFIECSDIENGPRLYINQPIPATKDLHILCDFDFFPGTAPENSPSDTTDPLTVSPGVSIDLFLTSSCLFEREPGFTASIKAGLPRKWQRLSGATKPLRIIPCLYLIEAFSSDYTSKLQTEIADAMHLDASDTVSLAMALTPKATDNQVYSSDSSEVFTKESKGYRTFILGPLYSRTWSFPVIVRPTQIVYPKTAVIRYDPIELPCTPFSSNSSGRYADIMRPEDDKFQQVYMKTSASELHTAEVLAQVMKHFPVENIQAILAVHEEKSSISFRRFHGETLNEVRLQYHNGHSPLSSHLDRMHCRTEKWFIDLELRRARDVLVAYERSFGSGVPITCSEQYINGLYYKRLLHDRRFREFYGACSPGSLESIAKGCITLEKVLEVPISINGQSYGSLRHHFDRAKYILDPRRPTGLSSLPCAFGFGDGHGGNVMVTLSSDTPSLLYVDYEVTGWHTPFLDLAKPIYLDGFFNAAYADLLYEKIPHKHDGENIWLDWKIEKDQLSIDYSFALEPLWNTLACIKLEYVLRPVLEMLEQIAPSQREIAEETLAQGLFCCALLSRNYSKRPDVFLLNLALGIRIATNMKEVFSECFGWDNWPHGIISDSKLHAHTGPKTESSQLILSSVGKEYLRHSRTGLIEKVHHRFPLKKSEILVAGLHPDWTGSHAKDIHLRWSVPESIDFETVFLKREDETLALHERFSIRPREGPSIVSRRIDLVRKRAMMISPFTCIAQCLFAEPRVDLHFMYPMILADLASNAKKSLIDVGCCMGTDIRTLIAHGYPAHQITGLDRDIRFVQLGYNLYNDRPEDLGVRFLEIDVLDRNFFQKCKEFAGTFDCVHSANVIHLFDESQQESFIRALAFLVKPGGLVWGRQVGLEDPSDDENTIYRAFRQPEGKGVRFTIVQFRQLWLRATGWDSTSVVYDAELVPYEELRVRKDDKRFVLQWCIRAPMHYHVGTGGVVDYS